MKEYNLKDLLVHKLKALYDIENELVKALPKMAKNASDSKLKQGFKDHLKETRGQVKRLKDAFKLLKVKPAKTKVEAIRGLAKDADWVMKNIKPKGALDANLIAAARYVEHYEIAGYTSARDWAAELGEPEIVDLLSETLEEEQLTDEKLATLAEAKISAVAA